MFLILGISMALTSAVIGNAYYQQKQFYPAVDYIINSNLSIAVIYIQLFIIAFMLSKLLEKIFFGTIRRQESFLVLGQWLSNLTEAILAIVVFRKEVGQGLVQFYTLLVFIQLFHYLAKERVNSMERYPVEGWLFHIRMVSLLSLLGILDYILLKHSVFSTVLPGAAGELVVRLEYYILMTVLGNTAVKYILQAVEIRTGTSWNYKVIFLLYAELFTRFIQIWFYVRFAVNITNAYGTPIYIFRPFIFTMGKFENVLRDVIRSHRAMHRINTFFQDATTEELRLNDNLCTICWEDMINYAKKLPCGHFFHTECLRTWFQRQETCPTCRLDVLRTQRRRRDSTDLPRRGGDLPAPVPGAAAAVGTGGDVQGAPNAEAAAPVRGNPLDAEAVSPTIGYDLIADGHGLPNVLPDSLAEAANLPTMPLEAPDMPPSPSFAPMPSDLTTLTNVELDAFEGNQRRIVEERIKLLHNIAILLDSTSNLFNIYQTVVMCLQSEEQLVAPTTAEATPSSSATATATTPVQQTQGATTVIINSPESDRPTTSAEDIAAAATSKAESGSSSIAQQQLKKVPTENLGADDNGSDYVTNSISNTHF